MTYSALFLALTLSASASTSVKSPVAVPMEMPALPQTAVGSAPAAISPHEHLLADFAANFQPGKAWTPQVAITPHNEALAQLLQQKVESVNEHIASERQQLQSLMAGMSHDWRNALNIVQLGTSMLTGSEKQKTMIKRAIGTINLQAENFLNMAKLEHGRMSIAAAPLRISSVLGDIVEHQRPVVEKNGNVLHMTIPADEPLVEGDAGPLSIVLNNLISNAAKYTKNGVITVGLQRGPAGTTEVFVEDMGLGMTQEDIAKISAGGFQRTAAGKKAAQGFGFGLPLAMKLLVASGTRLEIRSEPGKGSRFSFLLPTAP